MTLLLALPHLSRLPYQLLAQFQGRIAEYERAQILERRVASFRNVTEFA